MRYTEPPKASTILPEHMPTVSVDFDGVIHSYQSGWKGHDVITDPPVDGAFEWLAELQDAELKVSMFSSRNKGAGIWSIRSDGMHRKTIEADLTGIVAMQEWFVEHGMHEQRVMCMEFPLTKPAAILSIDDRAFCFEGTFPPVDFILGFKPWNKR